MLNKPNIIFVAALEQEIDREAVREMVDQTCITGVGKVNSAMNLTAILFPQRNLYKNIHVINIGSVGSLTTTIPLGSVIEVKSFVERDLDLTPLGVEKYVNPFETDDEKPRALRLYTQCVSAVCGSGDSFVTKVDQSQLADYQIVDMEGSALAKVCYKFGAKFSSLKYVTDMVDSSSWKENVGQTGKMILTALESLIRNILLTSITEADIVYK